MIITMFEGDTVAASGLTFVDELEPGVNHCFIRQMPTGVPQLFVSYSRPFTPEQLERLEQYGDMDIVPSDASWFEFSDGEITGFNYEDGREYVVIPYAIGGIPVTSIGELAFSDSDTWEGPPIMSVTAPKTVTTIGGNAFCGCQALTTISFPSATSIGDSAFSCCNSLTTVSLPLLTSIGDYAFSSCVALTTVSLPLLTSVDSGAFSYCYALTTISLPMVTTIGDNAFEECSELTSVSLPMVTTIGDNAFEECSELTSVSLPMVTTIGDYAFSYCSELTSVSLPMVTTIGDNAFEICIQLTTVSFLRRLRLVAVLSMVATYSPQLAYQW